MSAADLTISAARAALDAGELRATELLEAVLERAALTEAQLHAYLTIDHEGARRAAADADEAIAQGRAGALTGSTCCLRAGSLTSVTFSYPCTLAGSGMPKCWKYPAW